MGTVVELYAPDAVEVEFVVASGRTKAPHPQGLGHPVHPRLGHARHPVRGPPDLNACPAAIPSTEPSTVSRRRPCAPRRNPAARTRLLGFRGKARWPLEFEP
ncbi:MAG TPA: hypothetical protein VGS03_20065 [Candidatus Polarisedimenticolia bacterium]|nr:hypothetical protein [Candidatus Polarisedimenticolia bacterium]